jgi:hypothetical protein
LAARWKTAAILPKTDQMKANKRLNTAYLLKESFGQVLYLLLRHEWHSPKFFIRPSKLLSSRAFAIASDMVSFILILTSLIPPFSPEDHIKKRHDI